METYTLTRLESDNGGTKGAIIIGETHFHTLERPWINNRAFVSCIPTGTYLVKRDVTGKHQYYKLQDVPQRSHIEIHVANQCHQLQGCIALGFGWLYSGRCLAKSKAACDKFLEIVGDDDFYLEIIDA